MILVSYPQAVPLAQRRRRRRRRRCRRPPRYEPTLTLAHVCSRVLQWLLRRCVASLPGCQPRASRRRPRTSRRQPRASRHRPRASRRWPRASRRQPRRRPRASRRLGLQAAPAVGAGATMLVCSWPFLGNVVSDGDRTWIGSLCRVRDVAGGGACQRLSAGGQGPERPGRVRRNKAVTQPLHSRYTASAQVDRGRRGQDADADV